ncbi:MAG: TIR domain-containing protein [Anaerolineaceae bacterium]|nr:TIR domain-containing protein [Anaerolineaceae bacterium]
MGHVFISHSHSDADFVDGQLKYKLQEAGIEVWIDNERLQAGEDWRNDIDQAVRTAVAVVVVLSPASFESKYVTYEWAVAIGMGVKVVPIMLINTPLHPRLDVYQWMDFTHRTARPWEGLINRLKTIERMMSMPFPGLPATPNVPKSNPVPVVTTAPINPPAENTSSILDIAPIVDRLTNSSYGSTKINAVRELVALSTLINPQEILIPLLRATQDSDYSVRLAVAQSLGSLGNTAAIPALQQLYVTDPSQIVRNAAQKALQQLIKPQNAGEG